MENAQRRLMWHGMFLFLLGLLTGFAEASFANVRMGLAAHLEGVMNGIFLLALASAWVKLPAFQWSGAACVLGNAIRDVCELACDHSRRSFWHEGAIAADRHTTGS